MNCRIERWEVRRFGKRGKWFTWVCSCGARAVATKTRKAGYETWRAHAHPVRRSAGAPRETTPAERLPEPLRG